MEDTVNVNLTSDEVAEYAAEYFGESCVDYLTEGAQQKLVIWFPEVLVSNEVGDSIRITDLYVKLRLRDGKFDNNNFSMLRTSFTHLQFEGRYAHSHLPGDGLKWAMPCLGSGPIRRTLMTLRDGGPKEIWGLFFRELELYVATESLEGGPYKRISQLGSVFGYVEDLENLDGFGDLGFPLRHIPCSLWPLFRNFLKEFLSSYPIKIAFSDGKYIIGEDLNNLLVVMSDRFLKYFNKCSDEERHHCDFGYLRRHSIISFKFVNGKRLSSDSESFDRLRRLAENQSTPIITFKGVPKYLRILNASLTESRGMIVVLHPNLFAGILNNILANINLYHGREELFDKKYKIF